jgi:prepilin signal peptidase PulO-like enzyme (type II secretory pathway)
MSDELPQEVPQPTAVPPRASVTWLSLITLLLLLSFLVVEPCMHWWLHGSHDVMLKFGQPSWQALLEQRSLEFITILWFFMLGGSFGSFLHCLEYRLPRGISIAAQGSSCPGCHTKIKAWHNVPLFGWILLRGRCAACGWLIPVRYPLAELVFSVTFVSLMAVELIGGGCNLPLRIPASWMGVSETIWFPRWPLIGYYTFHVTLLTFLLTWCLFAYDHFRIPKSLFLLAGVIGVACPLIWPRYYPLDLLGNFTPQPALVTTLLTMASGASVGALLAILMQPSLPADYHEEVIASENSATFASMLLVGLFLGWQFVLGVAVLAILFRLITSWIEPFQRWPRVWWITLATLVQLLCWRAFIQHAYWPGNREIGLGVVIYPLLLMVALGFERRSNAAA